MKEFLISVVPVVAAVFGWAEAIKERYLTEVAAIIKRVEADSSMLEWSKQQKLEYVVELFEERVYPKLPIYITMFGKEAVLKWVMKAIDKIVYKAKQLKQDAEQYDHKRG